MHGRDPTQEGDGEVGVPTDVGETTCTEIEHDDGQVGDQDCHVLVICHRSDAHAKEASCCSHESKCPGVNHQVSKGMFLKLEAVKGAEADNQRVDPHEGQPLQEHRVVVGVHRVHLVRDLTLEHRVVLRDLQHLSETHVNELVTAHEERESNHVCDGLLRGVPLFLRDESCLFLSQLPENTGLEEGLHDADDD